MADGSELELWAPTLPRRVNKEHSVEKDDARNMVGGARQSQTVTRALDAIIYAAIIAYPLDPVSCFPLLREKILHKW